MGTSRAEKATWRRTARLLRDKAVTELRNQEERREEKEETVPRILSQEVLT